MCCSCGCFFKLWMESIKTAAKPSENREENCVLQKPTSFSVSNLRRGIVFQSDFQLFAYSINNFFFLSFLKTSEKPKKPDTTLTPSAKINSSASSCLFQLVSKHRREQRAGHRMKIYQTKLLLHDCTFLLQNP